MAFKFFLRIVIDVVQALKDASSYCNSVLTAGSVTHTDLFRGREEPKQTV